MKSIKEYRYEKKFIVPFSKQYLIPKIISSNGMRFVKHYESRKVNSIYLDTNNLTFYRENLEGLTERKKFRIRWYGELNRDTKFFFEIKQKNNELGFKKIYELENIFDTNNLLNETKKIIKSLKNLNISSNINSLLSKLTPKIIISYRRDYFISNIYNCRMTLDTEISYSIIDQYRNDIWDDNKKNNEMIIELKYPENLNQNIISERFKIPFRLSKNSKYVNGINKYYLKSF